MTDRIVEHKIKICEECEAEMTPNLYPGGDHTKPEDGVSYVASVVPAWTCSDCGFHSLVLKEEASDWLFANMRWHRSLISGMNIAAELAEAHGMGNHVCSGCGKCGAEVPDLESEEDTEEELPTKDGKVVH